MKEDGGGNQSSHHSYKGERSATREPINMNMERLGHSNVYYKNNFNFNFVKKTWETLKNYIIQVVAGRTPTVATHPS